MSSDVDIESTEYAMGELRKLIEEGVRVEFTFEILTRQFRAKMSGKRIDALLDPKIIPREVVTPPRVDFEATIIEAAAMFRYLWTEKRPSRESPRFKCVGACWTLNCECREHDGLWHPQMLPPLHVGCVCVVEPARRPTY